MRGPASLKQRILLLALTAITLVWFAAALLTYHDAHEELDEVLDAQLAQSATLLVSQAAHELNEIDTEHAQLLHKYSRHVAVQIWEDGQVLRMRSNNAPTQPLSALREGYSDATVAGKQWRVFSTWDVSGTVLIQIGEEHAVRDRLARDIALHLLYPLLITLPVLGLLLWLAVSQGLRPLSRLTQEVAQRQPDNLTPLDTGHAPAEVSPLIERLNHLFSRISSLIDNERRFTSDAAHELRTPVAAIKAQAQVARQAKDSVERDHALDGAIAGCDRATHLIEQLLTLARLESIDNRSRQTCNLHQLAAQAIADIAPAALQRGVQLELAEDGNINVSGLPALLSVLLRNLLDNAARHTTPGTEVRVEIGHDAGRPSITVSDNGPGLPSEELGKLAQRFYRPLGTAASGSGLGLSIVSRIAEIHGAELRFEHAAGTQGLRVVVVFPVA